jgi:probable addiction module antidote protein
MAKKIKISDLKRFDIAEYLDSEKNIAEYLLAAIDDEDPDFFLVALGDVARARGMNQIAEASGLNRESLYKALHEGAQPRFDTIRKVLGALGMRLTIEPDKVA